MKLSFTQEDFENLSSYIKTPEGNYNMRIAKVELNDLEYRGKKINITCIIIDGHHKDRIVYMNFWLDNPDWKDHKGLNAMIKANYIRMSCAAHEVPTDPSSSVNIEDPNLLEGKCFNVDLYYRNDSEYPSFKKYKPYQFSSQQDVDIDMDEIPF